MCGIAGIVSNNALPVSEDDIWLVTRSLAHRGPNGQKIWISSDKKAAFGHSRLSILDLSSMSDQPMSTADGKYSIVFNGEIYNFLEIRKELVELGEKFDTTGDTEVLLKGWRRWKWEVLRRMVGMWAFAIRDNASGTVYFCRDRFGVKPFVYNLSDRGMVFASETKALLSLNWVTPKLDKAHLQRIIFDPFAHEASEQTVFSNILKLPAGHYGEYRDGRITIQRWWYSADNLEKAPSSLDEAGEEFRSRFQDSVRLRMRSDVPLGTCLSGGFDSTAIVSTMSEVAHKFEAYAPQKPVTAESHAPDWRRAFVASFPGLGHDETAEAREAAAYAGIKPDIFDFSMDKGEENIDQILRSLDDVYISLPTAIWNIYQQVNRNDIRVTLDGHGADELFGGYRTANEPVKFALRNMLGANLGRGMAARYTTDQIRRHWFEANGKFFLRLAKHKSVARISNPYEHDEVPSEWSILDKRLYGMFHMDILPTLLRNYDRMSMAHGVEVRMPFMDHRLTTFIMSLPSDMKADSTHTKLAARVGMKGHMPEHIRSSPRKVGFSSQMPDWMNGSLGKWAERSLDNVHPVLQEIVEVPKLKAAIAARNQSKSWDWSSSDRIWPYINMNWYLNQYA